MPYAGIHAALGEMRAAGCRLYLCTAKPIVFAERIVERFGFADYVDGQHGPDLDGRLDDEGDLIAHILSSRGLEAGRGCMVGDYSNDTAGRGTERDGFGGRHMGLPQPR